MTVEFENQKVSTTAADGKWSVNLKPLKAGGPFTMTITGDNVVTVKDLLVGDVWLCSGQSNMHFRMYVGGKFRTGNRRRKYPAVRFFKVPQQMAQSPSTALQGAWKAVSPRPPASARRSPTTSAGTSRENLACRWACSSVPSAAPASSHGCGRKPSPPPVNPLNWSKSGADISPEDFKRIGAEYAPSSTSATMSIPVGQRGKSPRPARAPSTRRAQNPHPRLPQHLAQRHDRALQPFAIRGAIWYQGESNSGQPGPYQKLLPAMINDWRSVWGKSTALPVCPARAFQRTHPSFREAQLAHLAEHAAHRHGSHHRRG